MIETIAGTTIGIRNEVRIQYLMRRLLTMGMSSAARKGITVALIRDAESILPDHEVVVESGVDLRERLNDLLEKRQGLITAPVTVERDLELKEISRELRELGRKQL